MRAALLIGLTVALAGPGLEARAATFAPPLQPAAAGKMQCFAPDTASRTCRSLAAYRLRPNGGIDNIAIVLVSQDPVITMRTVSPVTVRAGQVCGPVRLADLESASFAVAHQPATTDETAKLRQGIAGAMKDAIGKEVCTAFASGPGGALTAKTTLNGVPQPEGDMPVIWVAPTDGYKVAP